MSKNSLFLSRSSRYFALTLILSSGASLKTSQ